MEAFPQRLVALRAYRGFSTIEQPGVLEVYWNPYDESREVADNENLLLWSDQRSHDSMLINLSLGVTAQIVPILVSCNHALVLRKVANTQYMLRALMIENTRPKPTLGYESVTRDVEVIFHECPQNK